MPSFGAAFAFWGGYMKLVTADQAIEILNRLHQKDFWAIQKLFTYRVECNKDLALDETCQVKQESDGKYTVSLIGIINAIFGIDEEKCGFISYSIDPGEDGFIQKFQRFEHTKNKNRRLIAKNSKSRPV